MRRVRICVHLPSRNGWNTPGRGGVAGIVRQTDDSDSRVAVRIDPGWASGDTRVLSRRSTTTAAAAEIGPLGRGAIRGPPETVGQLPEPEAGTTIKSWRYADVIGRVGCAVVLAPVWVPVGVVRAAIWTSRRVRGWYNEAWFAAGPGETAPADTSVAIV